MYLHRASWHSSATLTEVFPCFFLICKANAKVKPAKTGHGPHNTTFVNVVFKRDESTTKKINFKIIRLWASSSVHNVGSFPRGKRQGGEADDPTSCILPFKNEWSYAPTSPIRLHDVQGQLQLYLHRTVTLWLNCSKNRLTRSRLYYTHDSTVREVAVPARRSNFFSFLLKTEICKVTTWDFRFSRR